MYISQWITLPTQSCLVLYSFSANFLHSLTMWLMVSSQSPHNLYLLFCLVLFFRVFLNQLSLIILRWYLSDSKTLQVTRTLLSILAVLQSFYQSFGDCSHGHLQVPIFFLVLLWSLFILLRDGKVQYSAGFLFIYLLFFFFFLLSPGPVVWQRALRLLWGAEQATTRSTWCIYHYTVR